MLNIAINMLLILTAIFIGGSAYLLIEERMADKATAKKEQEMRNLMRLRKNRDE